MVKKAADKEESESMYDLGNCSLSDSGGKSCVTQAQGRIPDPIVELGH